jgi:hypothetical protein
MFLDEGVEAAGVDGVLGTDAPLGTISHGPVAFGAATWLALHPASDSTSAASKAAIRKGVFNTRRVLDANQAAMRSSAA